MTRKAYVVTDLGSGDGGKGSIVHALVRKTGAHTVIKRGGAQGNHGVRTAVGESFNFSQWGCGTLGGIPTHLSYQMIVSPVGLLNEAAALRYEMGIADPFGMLTIDGRCVCVTPYHGILSRVRELARGSDPRGTVGTGAGEAYRAYRHGQPAITAADLDGRFVRSLLLSVRQTVRKLIADCDMSGLARSDHDEFVRETGLLYDDGFLDYIEKTFVDAGRAARIVDDAYLADRILSRHGNVVVETSHGVLTDRETGFAPHVSAIRTLPSVTRRLLDSTGFDGQVINIGVMRAYAVRHGAGPLLTYDPVMTRTILPDAADDTNRYQGIVRAGPLDFVSLRRARDACGGADAFDGLAVTCIDQISSYGSWPVCKRYDADVPVIEDIAIAGMDDRQLYDTVRRTVTDALTIPVRLLSSGPTEDDKTFV